MSIRDEALAGSALTGAGLPDVSRRTWLKGAGLFAGGLAALGTGSESAVAQDVEAFATLSVPIMMNCCFGNPFYTPMMKGQELAAKQWNVSTRLVSPPGTDDAAANATLIESLLASKPDGIVVGMAYAQAVEGPLRKAAEQGIPIIAANTPDFRPEGERIPYLFYVGASEYLGGVAAAKRILAERKPGASVCVNPTAGHIGLQQRWLGFKTTMDEAGIPSEQLILQNADPTQTAEQLRGYLRRNPNTDAIYSVSASLILDPALAVLREQEKTGKVLMVTNDIVESAVTAVQDGSLLAIIDQQQYLQGWAPIALMALHIRHGFTLGGDLLTGPAIVDKSNIDKLIEASKASIR